MPISNNSKRLNVESPGDEIYALIEKLYPICRSITGNGVRETLREINSYIPIKIHEVPSGTPVFDWTVPREWNIKDAYIKNEDGKRIIDFRKLNLHVINYSIPVKKKLTLEELKKNIITLPDYPDWIPYRTSYYNDRWGFCMSHNQLESLPDGEYEICIDSSLDENGHLTYGELLIEGETKDEILLSAHTCHPSLANDNLSGIALLTFVARHLLEKKHRYSYRFLFAPGTIGSITWLARNEDNAGNIRHGLVVSCVGDPGGPTYKRSRRGDAEIDQVVEYVIRDFSDGSVVEDFSPYGYDERQYCSPGFNLPVGLFERSKYGVFPEYHTSADNLDFVKPEHLSESFQMMIRILHILENNAKYINTNPKCEPQLGKRGLYSAIGGDKEAAQKQMAMLWVLNLSDGDHGLLEISNKSGIAFEHVEQVSRLLLDKGLLRSANRWLCD